MRYTLYHFFFILAVVSGCSRPSYPEQETFGAREFLIDSYKIRQGKFSILALEGSPQAYFGKSALEEFHDVVQNGDVLKIAIYHPTRQDLIASVDRIGNTIGFRVDKGEIILPDIPPVKVAGLTLEEAKKEIQKTYLREIRDIEVFAAYKDRLERKIELAGQVQISSLPVDGKIRLFEALAKAKIPPDANLFKSYIIRDQKPLPVDFYKLLKEGDMTQNIVLHGGDKIYIAERSASTLMALGEVGKEGPIDLPSGYMPLREALAKAGGILYTGNKAYIQVIRGNVARPKIYILNWQHIIELPTESMLLMPGDIVYVAATPITEWNRFVNQLFPSFTVLDLFYKSNAGVLKGL